MSRIARSPQGAFIETETSERHWNKQLREHMAGGPAPLPVRHRIFTHPDEYDATVEETP